MLHIETDTRQDRESWPRTMQIVKSRTRACRAHMVHGTATSVTWPSPTDMSRFTLPIGHTQRLTLKKNNILNIGTTSTDRVFLDTGLCLHLLDCSYIRMRLIVHAEFFTQHDRHWSPQSSRKSWGWDWGLSSPSWKVATWSWFSSGLVPPVSCKNRLNSSLHEVENEDKIPWLYEYHTYGEHAHIAATDGEQARTTADDRKT